MKIFQSFTSFKLSNIIYDLKIHLSKRADCNRILKKMIWLKLKIFY